MKDNGLTRRLKYLMYIIQDIITGLLDTKVYYNKKH